jgi:hypothetical protein
MINTAAIPAYTETGKKAMAMNKPIMAPTVMLTVAVKALINAIRYFISPLLLFS